MTYYAQRALALLRLSTGQPDAEFRDGQEGAIRHVVEGRGRLLVVQKTGWGKSFVYFIAIKLLREAGVGPALLISPLLALMRNQVAAAERMGVRACRITSDNQEHWRDVEESLRRDDVDILLISPERLGNDYFRTEVLAEISDRIALLVVDEAHCISDWGHDFRPHYRLIERIARTLPANIGFLATTATANDRVMEDLRAVLGPDLQVLRGDLNRPSLMLQTIRLPRQSERLAWLAEQVPGLPGHGIIYTLTVRDSVQTAEWLRSRGLEVVAYTGQTEDREELEQALLDNRVKALVATTALGMGFDKPDLGFVVHYQAPASVVAYYQQVGRAGRALEAAYGVLLSGEEEADIASYFIDGAFPTPDEVEEVDGEPEGVEPPDLSPLPTEVSPDILHQAVVFLRRTSLPIKPRQQWPVGGLPRYRLSGRIAKEHRAEDGKSLCIWRDAGWGELVRRGKYQDGRFADELVSASVELMARWAPQPAPEWVTCIPSRRRPDLVPDFVERLAMRMGLPFHRALEKVEERAEQKSMENSTQQARNVDGSLAVSLRPLPGPVLLVDDLVDSRWTSTVAAWLLRSSGSGVVVPLSLAHAGYD